MGPNEAAIVEPKQAVIATAGSAAGRRRRYRSPTGFHLWNLAKTVEKCVAAHRACLAEAAADSPEPEAAGPTVAVRLANSAWPITSRIEHEYRELKTGLDMDHFEGRSLADWHCTTGGLVEREPYQVG